MKYRGPIQNILKVSGSCICHRIPERTFRVNNYYFPVCSRCTGIYLGSIIYFIYVYFYYVEYNLWLIILAILMIIPTFLDGLTQYFNLRISNNYLRFTSGVIAGLGLAILVKYFKWILFLYFGS